MKIEPMNNANPRVALPLEDYMIYLSEGGVDFDRFVEHGGRMLGRNEPASLADGLPDLREKIKALRDEQPRLARQLEFLANFFESDPAHMPINVRNETAFALLYAAKDMDLIPDEMPGAGYLDDAAVVENVLARHAKVFEQHCGAHGIEWGVMKPETAN
jgi:uncharacterized membrane protein YkvA (DUF1232 family)